MEPPRVKSHIFGAWFWFCIIILYFFYFLGTLILWNFSLCRNTSLYVFSEILIKMLAHNTVLLAAFSNIIMRFSAVKYDVSNSKNSNKMTRRRNAKENLIFYVTFTIRFLNHILFSKNVNLPTL